MIPNEFWIVVAQYDVPPLQAETYGMKVGGPIVFEGPLLTREDAEGRLKSLGTQYGWAHIMKVVSEGGKQS